MEKIVTKYLEGSANESEQLQLLNWLREKENRKAFNKYKLEWKKNMVPGQFPGNGEESWNRLNSKLNQESYNSWQRTIRKEWFYKVAAIFFFVISIGSFAWNFSHQSQDILETTTTVIAENGQISKVELPDGSMIWLNSGSTLSYNNHFSIENRNLVLTGEAYFDVSKNENLPFVVDCGGLKVKALGTRFNVNAYDIGKSAQIVLEDGVVELIDNNTHNSFYRMKPGDLVEIRLKSNSYKAETVNTMRYSSWKDGIVNIYNLSLDEVIKQLEKRYNQQFELTTNVKDLHYTFTIEDETLEDILKLMERITPIKIEQKGEIIKIEFDEKKLKKSLGK